MITHRIPLLIAVVLISIVSILLPSLVLAQAEDTATPTVDVGTVEPTQTALPTVVTTTEVTPVPTEIPTPTSTPIPFDSQPLTTTLVLTPTVTITPTVTFEAFFPLLQISTPTPTPPPPLPPVTYLFCNTPGLTIPDGSTDGLSNQIVVNQPGVVVDLNVFLQINHPWPGDILAVLDHAGYSDRYTLIDRPGVPSSPQGCSADNIQAIFDDQALRPAENRCNFGAYGPGVGGIFQPVDTLDHFIGQPATGGWWLNVFDLAAGDVGSLQKWCLEMTIADVAEITPTPTPIPVPASRILNVGGVNQALPLDCESRAAVDFAAYFGKSIPELQFFYGLPVSDDPDAGFVGDVNGTWGQIPPYPYGVHAEPIANLLTAYGVPSVARRPLRFDELKAEIAAGRPVLVWITADVQPGAPQYYIADSNHHRSIVARYEHTLMVRGYDQNYIYIRDGSKTYTRTIDQFIDSWSTMNFMAVIRQP